MVIILYILKVIYALRSCFLLFQVKTELREVSAEELASFMDEFNHHIFEMVSGSDVNEKKGGILAIGNIKLIRMIAKE